MEHSLNSVKMDGEEKEEVVRAGDEAGISAVNEVYLGLSGLLMAGGGLVWVLGW